MWSAKNFQTIRFMWGGFSLKYPVEIKADISKLFSELIKLVCFLVRSLHPETFLVII